VPACVISKLLLLEVLNARCFISFFVRFSLYNQAELFLLLYSNALTVAWYLSTKPALYLSGIQFKQALKYKKCKRAALQYVK